MKPAPGELFQGLLSGLGEKGLVARTADEGIKFRDLGKLLDLASDQMFANYGVRIHRRAAMRHDPESVDEFWHTLNQHICKEEGRIALLGMTGKHQHWTIVLKVSDKSLKLADSMGLKRLIKSDCSIDETTTHTLWPTQTYLLEAMS